MLSANIIGCGKLGKTIGKLLVLHQAAEILGTVNSSLESAKSAIEYVGKGFAYKKISELPPSDIYFITTQDDLIEEMANELQAANILKPDNIILHCSGSLDSDVLSKTRESGCNIASLHPIKSFANPDLAAATFDGTCCAIEGDEKAVKTLAAVFKKMGGMVFPVNKENKNIYHAAGVIANNYLVTLHYHAIQCYAHAGVDKAIAEKIVTRLMQDAFDNLAHLPHDKALTGPIQRGDTNTLVNHKISLALEPELKAAKEIYCGMGLGTLSFANLDSLIKNQIREILSIL